MAVSLSERLSFDIDLLRRQADRIHIPEGFLPREW